MKKAVCVLLSLMLILATASAMAATELNFGGTRNVQIQKAGDNTVEDGVSPTTGMTLADLQIPDGFGGMAKTGRYFPALVQIDNAAGGIGNPAQDVGLVLHEVPPQELQADVQIGKVKEFHTGSLYVRSPLSAVDAALSFFTAVFVR